VRYDRRQQVGLTDARQFVDERLTLWCPLLPYGYSYKASCDMQTGLSRHLSFLTSGHSDAQDWASECPDVKNYKWRLNPVWHGMLYSCIHMATVGIKGLTVWIEVRWASYTHVGCVAIDWSLSVQKQLRLRSLLLLDQVCCTVWRSARRCVRGWRSWSTASSSVSAALSISKPSSAPATFS